MNKQKLILKFFQKDGQLKISNQAYRQTITSLFRWLIANDEIEKDITSQLLKLHPKKTARIISHESATVAGIEEISYLIKQFTKLSFKPLLKDCNAVKNKQAVPQIQGSSNEILAYGRTIINFLQRMSGIATQTNHLIKQTPSNIYLAATRKTPWGSLDKKAVTVGGGLTHRLNLSDGILIKDNHLKLISIQEALIKTFKLHHQLIEIEVKTQEELKQAISAFNQLKTDNYLGIMFDNFSAAEIKKTITQLNNHEVIYEASGGINESNLKEYCQSGVDIISLGSLTHSSRAADFSLEII